MTLVVPKNTKYRSEIIYNVRLNRLTSLFLASPISLSLAATSSTTLGSKMKRDSQLNFKFDKPVLLYKYACSKLNRWTKTTTRQFVTVAVVIQTFRISKYLWRFWVITTETFPSKVAKGKKRVHVFAFTLTFVSSPLTFVTCHITVILLGYH